MITESNNLEQLWAKIENDTDIITVLNKLGFWDLSKNNTGIQVEELVKTQYRQALLAFHPDKHPQTENSTNPYANRITQKLLELYERFKNKKATKLQPEPDENQSKNVDSDWDWTVLAAKAAGCSVEGKRIRYDFLDSKVNDDYVNTLFEKLRNTTLLQKSNLLASLSFMDYYAMIIHGKPSLLKTITSPLLETQLPFLQKVFESPGSISVRIHNVQLQCFREALQNPDKQVAKMLVVNGLISHKNVVKPGNINPLNLALKYGRDDIVEVLLSVDLIKSQELDFMTNWLAKTAESAYSGVSIGGQGNGHYPFDVPNTFKEVELGKPLSFFASESRFKTHFENQDLRTILTGLLVLDRNRESQRDRFTNEMTFKGVNSQDIFNSLSHIPALAIMKQSSGGHLAIVLGAVPELTDKHREALRMLQNSVKLENHHHGSLYTYSYGDATIACEAIVGVIKAYIPEEDWPPHLKHIKPKRGGNQFSLSKDQASAFLKAMQLYGQYHQEAAKLRPQAIQAIVEYVQQAIAKTRGFEQAMLSTLYSSVCDSLWSNPQEFNERSKNEINSQPTKIEALSPPVQAKENALPVMSIAKVELVNKLVGKCGLESQGITGDAYVDTRGSLIIPAAGYYAKKAIKAALGSCDIKGEMSAKGEKDFVRIHPTEFPKLQAHFPRFMAKPYQDSNQSASKQGSLTSANGFFATSTAQSSNNSSSCNPPPTPSRFK
ncbi:J domain-containing protein [Legionella waltersii]|uniref:J domain-containing protein n=1 Tax=Legionella waltersii TaxID=66969 RepID=A0A0W1A0E0_9GAMM|nr:J domain-containing protein [Legionella waltersii]KTD74815.1 hypothetical protein Lwal_2856 [Legionella waltersii]SNV11576.1 Uncharacterised protein [Legionella waltersii]